MVAIYQKNIIQPIKMDTTANQENVCSICLNNLDGNNVCRTNCNHLFCFECLCQHVMTGANPSCPCCRNDFVSNDFISSIRTTTYTPIIDTPPLERQNTVIEYNTYSLDRNIREVDRDENHRVINGPIITISPESYSDHPIFRNEVSNNHNPMTPNPMTIDELSNENNIVNGPMTIDELSIDNESTNSLTNSVVTPPINEINDYDYTLVYNNNNLNDVCRNLDSWFGAETDFTNTNNSITIIPNLNNNVRLI